MNSDESSRGMPNHYTRKPMPAKYSDKNHYGPGPGYSYGNQSYSGNSHYNGGGNSYNNGHNGHNGFNGQSQNQRRRPDRFKRDNYNHNDRLIKQNDIIIRLLKEIRDRLPAPPVNESEYYEEDQDQRVDAHDNEPEDSEISDEDEVLMEPAHERYDSEQDTEYTEDDR